MSLIANLTEYLKTHREMSLNEMEALCKKLGYKISNAEKRLRDLRAPILTINGVKQSNPNYYPQIHERTNERGAIIGYYWQEKDFEISFKKWDTAPYCCSSKKLFGICSQDCLTIKEKINNTLF